MLYLQYNKYVIYIVLVNVLDNNALEIRDGLQGQNLTFKKQRTHVICPVRQTSLERQEWEERMLFSFRVWGVRAPGAWGALCVTAQKYMAESLGCTAVMCRELWWSFVFTVARSLPVFFISRLSINKETIPPPGFCCNQFKVVIPTLWLQLIVIQSPSWAVRYGGLCSTSFLPLIPISKTEYYRHCNISTIFSFTHFPEGILG